MRRADNAGRCRLKDVPFVVSRLPLLSSSRWTNHRPVIRGGMLDEPYPLKEE